MTNSTPGRQEVPWFALLLILAGGFLLLDTLQVVEFGFERILWSGLIVAGVAKTVQGFTARRSGMIFWGTMAFLYGIYLLLRSFELSPPSLFVPASLLVVGVAIFMTYLANLREWFLLLAALLFLALGSTVFLGQLEIYDVREMLWSIRKYWPVLLILAGLGLILRKVRMEKLGVRG